jgi:hypothetical protein
MQELLTRLLTLDKLLGSVPLKQQRNLDLEVIFSRDLQYSESQGVASQYPEPPSDVDELYKVADTVPRPDLIPATLVYICRTSWQGRTYENVYRHSDIHKPRDPTCSEVLQLLPKLDQVLETSLNGKINAIVGLGKCGWLCHPMYLSIDRLQYHLSGSLIYRLSFDCMSTHIYCLASRISL